MPNLNYNPETEIPDLSGKTIFITGGTNGLGAESALHLAQHNAAHIYISGRNAKSADRVIQRIRESGSSTEITFIECDLASLSSVKKTSETFVSQTSRLRHPALQRWNYGLATLFDNRRDSCSTQAEGIIFDKLKTVQDDFFVGGSWRRYGQSKLANLLYARELARRYPGIISASIHPGVVSTGLVGNQKFLDRALIYVTTIGKMLKPEEGAYNQVWAATTAKGNIENGAFYEPVGKSAHYKLGKTAKDDQLAERLWEWTQEALEEF
ncbi:oxidoreductase short-chain dehydrogenase/reductase family [Penicillium cosmopolitanum]|uniref:Oxidoreductase short-chain dehydrogenase/reductase family n=1 Tax=Penicillium cosmopolitanum TaxID=1131564 RepID=A0A9W9VR81_9EURO|nr:oxidoreductase short-chain dehydrogenase/reductase family [Penicillium cosmopolitanum]KAJ5387871.1 oxidoreductase short-chain dehydrogenase/reductase family [Penicillium cosmopolitanum]